MPYDLTPAGLSLLRLVDDGTFWRGNEYAKSGAVVTWRWLVPETQIYGEVGGSQPWPYTAIAKIARAEGGEIQSFSSTCTCPIHNDCKHGVAVALTALNADAAAVAPVEDSAESYEPRTAGLWERQLSSVLGDPDGRWGGFAWERGPRAGERDIALQFELPGQSERSGRTGVREGEQIGIRPVVRSDTGKWTKSHISWQSITGVQSAYSVSEPSAEIRQLLREVAATERVSSSTYYSRGGNNLIYLDELPSPRIWRLLAELRDLGVPFVSADKQSSPVSLRDEPIEIDVELRREAGQGLILVPVIGAAGDHGSRPSLASSLLLGDPPSGLAWWGWDGGLGDVMSGAELWLAPLSGRVDPVLKTLMRQRRVTVPDKDVNRFFGTVYPALRQKVSLRAAPEDVALPEQEPPTLLLRVEHGENLEVKVSWSWRYRTGDSDRVEPLLPESQWAWSEQIRDFDAEARILDKVHGVLSDSMELRRDNFGPPELLPWTKLDGFQAIKFLSESLPSLDALDDVEVTQAGESPDLRQASNAPVVEVKGDGDDTTDWYDLAVTITVDGEDVPFDQLFKALASGQSHFVLASGVWFSLDAPELKTLADLIAEARAINEPGTKTIRLNRYQAELWDQLEQMGVIEGQAATWQQTIRALSDATTIEQPELAAGFNADLRNYQAEGFAWLAFLQRHRLGGILADEMGLGKTVQTIALFAHARAIGETRPFIVCAPTSVVYNWQSECQKFAPDLKVAVITETTKRRGETIAEVAAGAAVVVTSYALFRIEYDEYASVDWAGLILDEAQFVKNHKGQTHLCAKRLPATFKLAITGTPMENNVMELWAMLSITAPGLFPSEKRFEAHYRRPIEKGHDREQLRRLRRQIAPLMLRRTKEAVAAELPPKQEQVIDLPLNPKHARIYQIYLQRERQKVLGLLENLDGNRFEIFRSLTMLRQASLDVSLIDPKHADVSSTKLDALMELLTEISSEGHRTVVFSQFTRFLGGARKRLDEAGIKYSYLDGSTKHRPEVIDGFRNGEQPVFLISLKAGGFGLTLTEADYCILLDPWWNPATEAQAVDRLHRIGQTKQVMVYRLVAKDTIEEKVMALKIRKAALFDSVMSGGDFAPTGLTAADIRGILD